MAETAGSGETLSAPRQGTFYPWSDGPQVCLGAKFSQVEFVAVVACLLREKRLSIVPNARESAEDIQQRVRSIMEDCDFQLLLRMKHSESIKIHCDATM